MKSINSGNLLETIGFIHPHYVEAAVYPSAGEGRTLKIGKRWRKAAVAAAAVLVLGVACVGFAPQVRALTGQLFSGRFEMDGDNSFVEETMKKIHIRDDVTFTEEDEMKSFPSINEAENYLGVTLLHSDRAAEKDASAVTMTVIHRGELITITDYAYSLFHGTIDEEGNWRGLGEDAYCISYEATFLTDRSVSEGCISTYADAAFVESYTTANGEEAGIFLNSELYHAVLYHDGIQYVFAFQPWRDEPGNRLESDLTAFKDFLDTLS